jgi:putative transposase
MPRIRAELLDAGIVASRKRIAALMRHGHMRGVSRRRNFCVTTERDTRHRPAPDLVNREFVASDINQLWVADMTYIPTWTGFVYLAMVIDVFSRKVVGWAFGERMTVTAMRAEDGIRFMQMRAHTRGDCFLADIGVAGSGDEPALMRFREPLLDHADGEHGAVKLKRG